MGYEHGDCLLDFAHELLRVKPNKIVSTIHGPRTMWQEAREGLLNLL